MLKVFLLSVIAAFVAETTCQQYVLPTFKPSPHRPVIIRTVRSAANDEPLWLYKGDDVIRAPTAGDHPYIPPYVDDVTSNPNQRYARSLDSPSAKRGGGSHQTSGSTRNTGATHPGYNRRNTRSIRLPTLDNPIHPFPRPTGPFFPDRKPIFPIYARRTRELHFPGMKKPSHRDVIIPNWNPNAKTNPWNVIVGKQRTRRGLDDFTDNDYIGYENVVENY